MPSETEQTCREFLDWWLDGGWQNRGWSDGPEIRARIVTEYLVERANRAMAEGVRRYVPVDGHDWHEGLQPATHEDVDRWYASGELHRAAGLPVPPELERKGDVSSETS